MPSIKHIKKKFDVITLVLIFSVSAVIAHDYFYRVDLPGYQLRLNLHRQIMAGTAPSPYNYRILVPFAVEFLISAISIILPAKLAFLLSYAIYDLLSIFILLTTLFSWLRIWFSRELTLIGILFVAGTMPIALQNHYYQPWSVLEAVFFTASLVAIHRKRYWLLALLVGLATLNRETAICIPVVFLLTNLDLMEILKAKKILNWKPILIFCGLFLTWAIIFLGLRYFRASESSVLTIKELLLLNTSTENLLATFVNGSLFLGGFWVFTVLGLRSAPTFIKQISLVVPFYVIAIIVWGIWYEVRLLMPMYPIFLSLGLSFLDNQELKLEAF